MCQFSTGNAYVVSGELRPVVGPVLASIGIVTDMACLDNNQVVTMVGVRAMPVNSKHAANPAMVKGKRAKMLGKQNNRESLVLVRTEGSGGYDVSFSKTKFHAEIIELGDKFRIGYGHAANFKWCDFPYNIRFPVFIEHPYSSR